MPNFVHNGLARLVRETGGAEIAEAAAVLPIMFMMLIGIFWFGQAFSIYGTITRAAQEGARAAAAPQCSTCAAVVPATNATNAIHDTLVAAHLDPSKAQRPGTIPTVTACPSPPTPTPTCDAGLTNACLQSNVRGSSTDVCGVWVSLQYPYQFWLPFTSLNKQMIHLTASARVRLETM